MLASLFSHKKFDSSIALAPSLVYHGLIRTLLSLALKKKSAPGKFRKQPLQNTAYFNLEKTFLTRKKQKIDKIDYYCLKKLQTNRNVTKKFQRTELFEVKNNFCM